MRRTGGRRREEEDGGGCREEEDGGGHREEEAHEEGDDWGCTLGLTSDRSRVRSTIFYFPK
jgi:hypothetical protein